MQYSVALLFCLLTTVVNAHFQVQFPPPRGSFVEDDEINFCDGYGNVTTNRTTFPLSGGFYSIKSEHAKWIIAVYLSTAPNPSNFTDFQLITSFKQGYGEGIACLDLDLSKTNATNLSDGENATLQFMFSATDGNLYQCSDVTLSSTANVSSGQCTSFTTASAAVLDVAVSSIPVLYYTVACLSVLLFL